MREIVIQNRERIVRILCIIAIASIALLAGIYMLIGSQSGGSAVSTPASQPEDEYQQDQEETTGEGSLADAMALPLA